MPAITTHNIFAKKVMKKYDPNLKDKLKVATEYYELFSQSFDFFFFNMSKQSKKIRKFGGYAHRSNTQSYLINIVKNIKEQKLEKDASCLAYLFGSINHYVLDSTCHPFIFYKSGCFRKTKETKRYYGKHTEMENSIDAYFYEKEYHKPFYKYKIHKEILPNIKPTKSLLELMNKTYKNTYNKENLGTMYWKSYKHAIWFYRFGMEDRLGIKKGLYKIIDTVTNKHFESLAPHSYYYKKINLDYLNLKHNTWCHPCDQDLHFTTSFLDLFNEAIEKAVFIAKEVNLVLENKKELKSLINVIPNLSYSTGLPIENNKPLQFFEY